jgi:hypothetical protein
MSREAIVPLHRAVFVQVAMLAISLVINIQVIILAKATSFIQSGESVKEQLIA